MPTPMIYRGKKVLVTGAGGFIGSHLVESLVRGGACVRALLRYSSRADVGNLEFLPQDVTAQTEVIRGDLRDPHFMLGAGEGCEVVFHLGALIAIPYSYQAPGEYIATNVVGTLNVLEAARIHKMSRVIHISTSETYGTAQYTPIDEQHCLIGQSPYAASKIGADKLTESYFHSYGIPVVTVRPFNTYGPRQSARAVIPTILSQLLAGCEALRLGSLAPVRDLTYVSDTVAGMLALGGCDQAIGKTVNLGTGEAVSVGNLARKCIAAVGRDVPIELEQERVRPEPSEVMVLLSNNGLAKALCGWEPHVAMEEGLQRSAEFIGRFPGLYRPKEYQR